MPAPAGFIQAYQLLSGLDPSKLSQNPAAQQNMQQILARLAGMGGMQIQPGQFDYSDPISIGGAQAGNQFYEQNKDPWAGALNMLPYAALAGLAPYAIGALGGAGAASGGAGAATAAGGVTQATGGLGALGGMETAAGLGAAGFGGGGLGASTATLPEVTVTGAAGGLGGLAQAAIPAVGAFAGTQLAQNTGGNTSGNPQSPIPSWLSPFIGPLISGAGGYLGQQQAGNAAENAVGMLTQAARPYNVSMPGFGSTTFDPNTRTAGVTPGDVFGQFGQQNSAIGAQGFNGLQMGSQNPFGMVSPQLDQANQGYNGMQGGAAGAFTGAGQNFLNQATGFDIPGMEATNLSRLRAQSQFGEGQARQNNLESQFGRGILASTAGGYQTQALEQALQSADIQRQGLAHSMAMGDQQSFLNNALGAGNFGNNLSNNMFQNAVQMFGAGMGQNQQQFGQNNALYNQGQQNTLGIGNYLTQLLGLGGNLGNLSSGASGTAAGIMAQNGQNSGNALAGFLNNLGSGVDWGKILGGP